MADNISIRNIFAEQLPAGALITEVDDMSEHQIYLTSSLNITCTATQYLFSDGLQLAVSFNNGSIGSTEDMVEAAQSMPSTKGYYHYEWMVNVTSTDIRKYICVAPLLKSNQWKVKPSVEFNVTVGSRPIFLKNDSRSSPPVLKFRMSDTNVRISCVAEGDPQPEINWYRSGHELFSLGYNSIEKLNIKHYNTVVSSLEIPSMKNMGADVWGIWVCNASNVLKPDAFYEINVEIDEEDSSPVTNILFVALAVVSLIIGAGCFVWHKISTNQRIEKV
ncbi:unnamed protein product [Allacma fusca]|uniref:Ig-like domain-containing protein n=1 Tax=Allacma fusca TaxID=39272 RepID=A0A8J2P0Q2_9HEXA|nr:unnamed protein product [Allacma fusca]